MPQNNATKNETGKKIAEAFQEIKDRFSYLLNFNYSNDNTMKLELANTARASILEFIARNEPCKAVALARWVTQQGNITFQDLNIIDKSTQEDLNVTKDTISSDSVATMTSETIHVKAFLEFMGLCDAMHISDL
ncbi:MAG: hypothetical protein K0Q51_102 [Rickettsiaceae bacterium]|jgi:hypothetical protein|nr:hypothetical protein [Rickettsiaceae bacterium]